MTISVRGNREQDIKTGWEWLLELLAPPAYQWLLQQDLSPALLEALGKRTPDPPTGTDLERWRIEAEKKGYEGSWLISGPGIDSPIEDQPLTKLPEATTELAATIEQQESVVEKLAETFERDPEAQATGEVMRRMGPRARPLPVEAMPGSPGYQSMLSEYQAWGYTRPELRGILEQGGMTDVSAGDASDFLSRYFSDVYGGTPPKGITPAEWRLYPGGWQARARDRVQLPKGMEKPKPGAWTKEIGALMEKKGIAGDPSLMVTRHQVEDYTRGELMASRQGMRSFFSAEAITGTWPGIPGEEEGTAMLYKDPEDPAQRLKLAKSVQRGLVYPQVELWKGKEHVTAEGPRRVGPASTRPERGVTAPMVLLMEEWLPEGMIYLPRGFYTTATRRRVVDLSVPKDFKPEMEHKGRIWARGDEVKPFVGAAPVDLRLGGGWDRATLMDYSLEPEIRTKIVGGKETQEEGQRLRLTFGVAAGPEAARLSMKSLWAKFMAPMTDTERILGEKYAGYGVSQIKDPTMLPFSWWYAQKPEERAALWSDIKGEKFTAEQVADIPWQQAGREVAEHFREKILPDIYREIPLHFRVHESILRLLPEELLDMKKSEPVADVPEFWDITTRPVPALVAKWWMDVRKGWGVRQATLPYRELRVLERVAPTIYKDVMKRAQPIMDAYRAIVGGAVGKMPKGTDPVTPTTEEVEKLFAMAEERAGGTMVPESALQHALIESAAEIWGTSPLKLGEQGVLAGPAHARRFTAEGVFEGEEVSGFGMAYAEALRALGEGRPEQVKVAFNRALVEQEKMASAKGFFRKMLSAHLGPRAVGDVIYGSDLLKPHEFTAPVGKVLRAYGIKRDTPEGNRKANVFLAKWQSGQITPSALVWGHPVPGEDPFLSRIEAVHPEVMKERAGKMGIRLSGRTPLQISAILAEALGRDFDEDLIWALFTGEIKTDYGPEQITGTSRPITGMRLEQPKDVPLATPMRIIEMAEQRLMAGRGSHARGAFLKPPPGIDRAMWEEMEPLQRIQATLDPQNLATADAGTFRESLNWMARAQSNIGKYFNLLEDVQVAAGKLDPKAEKGLRKAADTFFEIVHGKTQTPTLLPPGLQEIMSRLATGVEWGSYFQELKGETGERAPYKGQLPGLVGLRQKIVAGMMSAEAAPPNLPKRLQEKAEEQWVDVVARLAFPESSYEEAKKAIREYRAGTPGERSTKWGDLAGSAEEWVLNTPLGIVAGAHMARRSLKRGGMGLEEDLMNELLGWADLFGARRTMLSKQGPPSRPSPLDEKQSRVLPPVDKERDWLSGWTDKEWEEMTAPPISLRNPADPAPDLPELFKLQESEVGLLQQLRAGQKHPDDVRDEIRERPTIQAFAEDSKPDTTLVTLNDDEVRLLDAMKVTRTPSRDLANLATERPLSARSLTAAVEQGKVPSYQYPEETEEEKERRSRQEQIQRRLDAQAIVGSAELPVRRPKEATAQAEAREEAERSQQGFLEDEVPRDSRTSPSGMPSSWTEEDWARIMAQGIPPPTEQVMPVAPRRAVPAAQRLEQESIPFRSEAMQIIRDEKRRQAALLGGFSATKFESAITKLEGWIKKQEGEEESRGATLLRKLPVPGEPLVPDVKSEINEWLSLQKRVATMARYYAEEPGASGSTALRLPRAEEALQWEGFAQIEGVKAREKSRIESERLARMREERPTEEARARDYLGRKIAQEGGPTARQIGISVMGGAPIELAYALSEKYDLDIPARQLRAIRQAEGIPGLPRRLVAGLGPREATEQPPELPIRRWLMEQAQDYEPETIPTSTLLRRGFMGGLPQEDLQAVAAMRGEFLPSKVTRAYGVLEAFEPTERKAARGQFAEQLWPKEVAQAADVLTQRFRDLGLTLGEVKGVIGKYGDAQQAEVARLGEMFRTGAPVEERAAGLERLGAFRRYFGEVAGMARDRRAGITTPEGFQVRVAGAQEALAGTLEAAQPPQQPWWGGPEGPMGVKGPLRGAEETFRYLTQYWNLMRMQRVWGMTGGAVMGQVPIAAGEEQAAARAAMVTVPMGQFQQAPMVSGLTAYAAQQQRFRGQVGRAAYGAWGGIGQGLLGEGLATAAGIGGVALGGGAIVGMAAQALIPGLAATGVGIPVAAGLAAYGAARYARGAMGDRERMAIAAAEGPSFLARRREEMEQAPEWWQTLMLGQDQEFFGIDIGAQQRPEVPLAEYGQQILTGPLAELSPAARIAAIQKAVQVATEEGGPLEGKDTTAMTQMLAEWYRVTPGAEEVPPSQILEDPRFAAMAARGLGPQTVYAEMAQQWGMAPSGWERMQEVTGREPEAWVGTMMQYAPAARFGVTPEMVQEEGWGPLEGQAQFQFQRLMAGDRGLWSQYAREGQAPAWMQTVGEYGTPIGTRALAPLMQSMAARAVMPGAPSPFGATGGPTLWGAPQAIVQEGGGMVPVLGGEAEIGVGGLWGLQDWRQEAQRAFEDWQTDFQQGSLDLQREYMLGSSEFGRGIWAIQAEMRDSQRDYQETQLGFQARQIELQDRMFGAQMQLQREQAGVEAEWGREDLGRRYERGMVQIGWQEADLATRLGRQRIGFDWQEQALVRQLGRQQIGFDWQEHALAQQEARQEVGFGWQEQALQRQRARQQVGFEWQEQALTRQFGRQEIGFGWQEQALAQQRARQQVGFGWQEQALGRQVVRQEIGFGWQEQALARQGARQGITFGWQEQALAQQQARQQMGLGWQEQALGRQWERGETQFGWAQEDLAFGRARGALQFGWQMEDVEENIRFATGRQRERLMTQRERATVMYGMGEARAEEEGERLEQRREWAREDHETAREQTEARRQWTEEDLATAREQLEQRRAWTEEDLVVAREQLEQRREWAQEDFEVAREQLEQRREWAAEDFAIAREQLEQRRGWAAEDFVIAQEQLEQKREWAREDLETAREQLEQRRLWAEEDMATAREQLEQRRLWAQEDLEIAREQLEQRREWAQEDFVTQTERLEQRRAWLSEDHERELSRHNQRMEWANQRFDLAERQHTAQVQMTRDRHSVAVAHFNEQTRLQNELTRLQQTYWTAQHTRQQTSIDKATEHRGILRVNEDLTLEATRQQQIAFRQYEQFFAAGGPFLDALDNILTKLQDISVEMAIR